jgi:hypothetical protein
LLGQAILTLIDMMVKGSNRLFQDLHVVTALEGHGIDEELERGFTSGHKPSLNTKYATATWTYESQRKSTCKRGRFIYDQ